MEGGQVMFLRFISYIRTVQHAYVLIGRSFVLGLVRGQDTNERQSVPRPPASSRSSHSRSVSVGTPGLVTPRKRKASERANEVVVDDDEMMEMFSTSILSEVKRVQKT